jgi:outer membrane protein assembly factor BamA
VEGLGGGKTLRGILRNRIWGDGFLYGNVELRVKMLTFGAINQRIELKFKPFFDFGTITDLVDYNLTPSTVFQSRPELNIAEVPDKLHASLGAGIHFVMNDNFILSIDYGKSLNVNDGNSGLYIGTGFLF